MPVSPPQQYKSTPSSSTARLSECFHIPTKPQSSPIMLSQSDISSMTSSTTRRRRCSCDLDARGEPRSRTAWRCCVCRLSHRGTSGTADLKASGSVRDAFGIRSGSAQALFGTPPTPSIPHLCNSFTNNNCKAHIVFAFFFVSLSTKQNKYFSWTTKDT